MGAAYPKEREWTEREWREDSGRACVDVEGKLVPQAEGGEGLLSVNSLHAREHAHDTPQRGIHTGASI